EASDLVALGTIEVDRISPRRPIAIREVRAKTCEVIPARSEVVVDDVQDHRKSASVAGVYQALEALRPAIAVAGSPEIDAVVSPPVRSRKFRNRHELDVGHAQGSKMPEPLDDGLESSGGRERADMELVDHSRGQWRRLPAVVRPRESRMVDQSRPSVDTPRLAGRSRVRQWRAVVDHECVVGVDATV